jgi:hypothetical protein
VDEQPKAESAATEEEAESTRKRWSWCGPGIQSPVRRQKKQAFASTTTTTPTANSITVILITIIPILIALIRRVYEMRTRGEKRPSEQLERIMR